MKWREQASILGSKAAEDLYLMLAHQADYHVSDGLQGLHAQQAAEKLLKSLLAHQEIPFPFTHRLVELADLLVDAGVDWPNEFDPLLDLTPYAVELRYAVLPEDHSAAPLDRANLIALVEALQQYVAKAVRRGS